MKALRLFISDIPLQRLVLLSFAGMIAAGTWFFAIEGTQKQFIPLVDRLFLVTSAICVTGLSTFNLAERLALPGEIGLLMMIQAGGLGFMTFATAILSLGSRSMGARQWNYVQESYGGGQQELKSLLKWIFIYTILIEGFGASCLLVMAYDPSLSFERNLFVATFHAVSSFCNAGFSLYHEGYIRLSQNTPALLTTALLITLGGLGYAVLFDLRQRFRTQSRRMTLHSQIVLSTSLALVVLGTLGIMIAEWDGALMNRSLTDKFVQSLFLSVSARTAGLHTFGLENIHNHTVLVIGFLMMIGGSPGSCAGGLKTTTAALLWRVMKNRLLGRPMYAVSSSRNIHPDVFNTAVALTLGGFVVVNIGFFLLLLFQQNYRNDLNPMSLLFEVLSAFGTVGLSMGVTESLTTGGKLLVSGLMLFGRLGGLVVIAAIARPTTHSEIRFPEEDVMVG